MIDKKQETKPLTADEAVTKLASVTMPIGCWIVLHAYLGKTNSATMINELREEGNEVDGVRMAALASKTGMPMPDTVELMEAALRFYDSGKESSSAYTEISTAMRKGEMNSIFRQIQSKMGRPSQILAEAAKQAAIKNLHGCTLISTLCDQYYSSANSGRMRDMCMAFFGRMKPDSVNKHDPWFHRSPASSPDQFSVETRALRVKALTMAAWLAEQEGL